MQLLRSVLLLVLSFSANAATSVSGVWGVESWNCGGNPCSRNDIKMGNAVRTFEGLRLVVRSGRACGVWYSQAQKVYRGFVKGRDSGSRLELHYGQEMDHDARFYGATTFAALPSFTSSHVVAARLFGQSVTLEYRPLGPQLPPTRTLRKLSPQAMVKWGLVELGQWEKEHLESCQREA